MMYKNNLAVAIKVGGRVLREQGDVVRLPFGSEYSILLKNLNSVRVQFKLQIDGDNATGGTWIVIPANQSVEIERFIRNNNWNEGNRFKFIERTAAVEQHRGARVDDGLIRIEYQREHKPVFVPPPQTWPYYERRKPSWPSWPYPQRRWTDHNLSGGNIISPRGVTGQSGITFSYSSSTTPTSSCENAVKISGGAAAGALSSNEPETETGITVEGSHSSQRFSVAEWFEVEAETHVMVIHLKGEVAGQRVTKPITVEQKLECKTCGRTNKSSAKFCSQCGTALTVYA